MDTLFSDDLFVVRPIAEDEIASTLRVYEECEDFLSLGPVPKASLSMVLADIKHCASAGGLFCGIWDRAGTQVGVLDFVPDAGARTGFLSLLMIGAPHRNRGLGTGVLAALESYLAVTHGTKVLDSGVQVNNGAGIAFWEKRGFRIDRNPRALEDGTTVYTMSRRIPAETPPVRDDEAGSRQRRWREPRRGS